MSAQYIFSIAGVFAVAQVWTGRRKEPHPAFPQPLFVTRNGLFLESAAASSNLSFATPLFSKYLNGFAKGFANHWLSFTEFFPKDDKPFFNVFSKSFQSVCVSFTLQSIRIQCSVGSTVWPVGYPHWMRTSRTLLWGWRQRIHRTHRVVLAAGP